MTAAAAVSPGDYQSSEESLDSSRLWCYMRQLQIGIVWWERPTLSLLKVRQPYLPRQARARVRRSRLNHIDI